jgi:hypothetical protein
MALGGDDAKPHEQGHETSNRLRHNVKVKEEKMGLQIISYLCLIVFISAVGVRVKTMEMPVHFRWELCPVQHEPGKSPTAGLHGRGQLVGKKRRKSLFNEIKYGPGDFASPGFGRKTDPSGTFPSHFI